jgi:hypothetical protein
MMLSLHDPIVVPAASAWRVRCVAIATVIGWLLFAALVARSYFGHSASPYGVCYAASGRSVPCELVRQGAMK